MAISSNATAITFNDATTQTTAPVNTNANVVAIAVTSPIVSSGGTSPTISHATSGVTAGSYTSASITVNAQGHVTAASNGAAAGTVTSVATGNGLQGGTITSTGTLSVACPGYNTVGSYVWCYMSSNAANNYPTSGTNYSAGGGVMQMQSGGYGGIAFDGYGFRSQNNLSGTWKWMGSTFQIGNPALSGGDGWAIACRVA